MAVYYKFKSARDYDSIPMDGPFISVGTLKEKIFESKHLGRGTDFDLLVTNAQTNEEYLDEETLVPKNTSVLIRRVPGQRRLPIVAELQQKVENNMVETDPGNSSLAAEDMSAMKYPEDSDWDEFGNDLYSIPDQLPVQSVNLIPEAPPTSKVDEESKLKALIDTPALDWQHQSSDFGPGRGFGRGMGGRMGGGRGFGLERKTPPQGYVCHRCKMPGHFIQHCPTNGDPNYDIKRVKQPTGIPRSMLMVNPQGSYALPNGSVAVLKPNEAAFEKEIEGMPSTRSVGDLPPELHCPLCSNVMKDAVLTSKCCFKSFCDKCIRDYIISKSRCVCGATNILADDLLPNKTLRDTINRILESGNSSTENAGSTFQVQDMESARCPQPKNPSPTSSAASKGELKISLVNDGTPKIQETAGEIKAISAPQQTSEHAKIPRVGDVSEATHESMSVKEPVSQGSAQVVEEEVQQKLVPTEAAKKKKKKKVRMPANDFQWKPPHDLGAENYMMPMGPPPGYNPYWNGIQPGMDGFMAPYAGPMHMMGYGLGPYDMPFANGMAHDPFANGMPHDPFANGMAHDPFGMHGYMMPPIPPPPHRDLAEFSMGMNGPPPAMSREEFEARNANLRRKRENERRGERDFSKDREFGREASSVGDVSSIKSKTKPIPPSAGSDYHQHRHRSERLSPDRTHREVEPPRPIKRKSDHHSERERDDRDRDYDYDYDYDRHQHRRHHRTESSSRKSLEPVAKSSSRKSSEPVAKSTSRKSPEPVAKSSSNASQAMAAAAAAAAAERKHKASVFTRISFPSEEEAAAKKRKLSTTSVTESSTAIASASAAPSHSYYEGKKSNADMDDYESSDDERHFKRRPSRYEPSPPPQATDWKEEGRHSRGTRDRKHR
ncbi:E3 ubiquitin ligase PQT3-like [Vicia villosa]|uniref:E3 ubiquitin ligase PQT3-like n=1 Tax=Vicia villosa TaxID=3911 RepID=UPI00273C2EE6|nr:E3 ubiquitin ligase PQT3-like [Vicia villosa]